MKKTNPRKKPVSKADLEKAKREAQYQAVNIAWAIMFSVLRDKEGYGAKRLQRVWGDVNNLSDSISNGYVSIDDLMETLKTEAGIVLK